MMLLLPVWLLLHTHTPNFCLHSDMISVSLVVDEDSHFVKKL